MIGKWRRVIISDGLQASPGFSLVAGMDIINLVHFVRPPGRPHPVIDVLIDGYNSADMAERYEKIPQYPPPPTPQGCYRVLYSSCMGFMRGQGLIYCGRGVIDSPLRSSARRSLLIRSIPPYLFRQLSSSNIVYSTTYLPYAPEREVRYRWKYIYKPLSRHVYQL